MSGRYRNELVGLIKELGEDGTIVGAEIGVCQGKGSAHLLKALPNLFLYMIDPWSADVKSTAPWDQETFEKHYQMSLERTEPYKGRRTVWRMTSKEAAVNYGLARKLDFVFIDGDHSEEGVYRDLGLWHPIVCEGGLILMHDYGSRRWHGVKKAADRYAAENNLTIEPRDYRVAVIRL